MGYSESALGLLPAYWHGHSNCRCSCGAQVLGCDQSLADDKDDLIGVAQCTIGQFTNATTVLELPIALTKRSKISAEKSRATATATFAVQAVLHRLAALLIGPAEQEGRVRGAARRECVEQGAGRQGRHGDALGGRPSAQRSRQGTG